MTPTPAELKKNLVARGFEVYRTLGDQVVLADRVRENLILDSGVAARPGAAFSVRFIVRAQGSDFPNASPDDLFERARAWVKEACDRGYNEVATAVVPVRDPGDPSKTLDTWYEVLFERNVGDEDELDRELRYALALDRTVAHGR